MSAELTVGPMVEWTAGKFTLSGVTGPLEVDGQLTGCRLFGIRRVGPDGSSDRGELRVWQVTHIPTGMKITGNQEFVFTDEDQAKIFVREILPLADWKNLTNANIPEGLGGSVRDIQWRIIQGVLK